jgi:hypothetical protein
MMYVIKINEAFQKKYMCLLYLHSALICFI